MPRPDRRFRDPSLRHEAMVWGLIWGILFVCMAGPFVVKTTSMGIAGLGARAGGFEKYHGFAVLMCFVPLMVLVAGVTLILRSLLQYCGYSALVDRLDSMVCRAVDALSGPSSPI